MYNKSSAPLPFDLLRRYALILLRECEGTSANVLRAQIEAAQTPSDLTRMRSAIFECMCMHLGEAEAMDRIRSFDLTV